MRELANREKIIEQLTELLVDFDKSCNRYQTDVYLYYDDETHTATLDTFINVGGNSWLNDAHYTIYRDTEHFEDWVDFYCNAGDFAWGLGMNSDSFDREILDYLDLDEDEKEDYQIDWYEERDYVLSRDDYREKLIEVYEEYIEENRPEYAEQAEHIISEWESEDDESF